MNRVYVLGLDEMDFAIDVTRMEDEGYLAINGGDHAECLADEIDLRVHLVNLAGADFLMLPDLWWTSTVAHQLVMVAGWLGVRFLNRHGSLLQTVGAVAR